MQDLIHDLIHTAGCITSYQVLYNVMPSLSLRANVPHHATAHKSNINTAITKYIKYQGPSSQKCDDTEYCVTTTSMLNLHSSRQTQATAGNSRRGNTVCIAPDNLNKVVVRTPLFLPAKAVTTTVDFREVDPNRQKYCMYSASMHRSYGPTF